MPNDQPSTDLTPTKSPDGDDRSSPASLRSSRLAIADAIGVAGALTPNATKVVEAEAKLLRARNALSRGLEPAGPRAATVAVERILLHHEGKSWSRERRKALVAEIMAIPADLLDDATTAILRASVYEPKPADWWTRVDRDIGDRREALRKVEEAIERKRQEPGWTPPTPEQRQRGLQVLGEIRQRLAR